MKIAQYHDKGTIRLGLVENDHLQPVDFDGDMMAYLRGGGNPKPMGEPIALSQVRFAPVMSRPSKIIAIGLNYLDHAREGKAELPESPLIFTKFPNSLTGHRETIRWRESVTRKVDFEAELAVVIGKKVFEIPEDRALEAVFGYTCANDVSARDLQFGDGQWVRGKSLDTFCPIGPWIVTADEIENPHHLNIQSRLNGQVMQDSNTQHMIFSVAFLVAFMSRHFTLFPGDVILTGTPSGVGVFREPSLYMKDGDEIVVAIEKIGELVNTCQVDSNSLLAETERSGAENRRLNGPRSALPF